MTVMYTAILYINHSSGQTGSWKIEVEEQGELGASITTQACKVLDGKPVQHVEWISQGKNLGRANETTALEQAIAEAKSKAQKKVDKGYTYTIPVAGQKAVNSLGLTKPMLAEPFIIVTKWPVFIQHKLDGNRCLAARVDGKVKLWSLGGKEINLPHIAEALENILPEGLTLDGELYVHGKTLQTISSWIKKLQPESQTIEYKVYDCVMDACYSERLDKLRFLIDSETVGIVSRVHTRKISSEGELDHYHQLYIQQGYEGTMVRTLGVGYEDGKRSRSLQKLKDFQDAEFEIVAVTQGTPRIVNGEQLEVAIYTCKAPNGKTFTAVAPGGMCAKHTAWVHRHKAIGKQLTVKFFNWTPDGLPFLPVALRIRDDL